MDQAEQEALAIAQERKEVEDYLKQHSLESVMNEIVNFIVRERPEDPFSVLADELRATSQFARQILGVRARELIGIDGNPILEAEVETCKGMYTAQVSTGPYDEDEERYDGRGMLKAVEAVHNVLAEKLVGKDPTLQSEIDRLLQEEKVWSTTLPLKLNAKKVRANAVLAVSAAAARAGAALAGLPVGDHLLAAAGLPEGAACLPAPHFSALNGGRAAHSKLWVQEVTVLPVGARTFQEAVEMGLKFQKELEKKMEESTFCHTNYGSLGGLAPVVENFDDIMMLVVETLDELGYSEKMKIGVDVAAAALAVLPGEPSEADAAAAEAEKAKGKKKGKGKKDKEIDLDEDGIKYELSKWVKDAAIPVYKSANDMIDMYVDWFMKYPLATLGNPFHPDDKQSYIQLRERIDEAYETKKEQAEAERGEANGVAEGEGGDEGSAAAAFAPTPHVGGDEACPLQLWGAGVAAPTPQGLAAAEEARVANTLALSLGSAGGTVTGALALCARARALGWGVLLHPGPADRGAAAAAEVDDDFIVEFAVGSKAGQIKLGALRNAENISKCNQLLRIETSGLCTAYAANSFRKLP